MTGSRLPVRLKLIYGVGEVTNSVKMVLFSLFLFFFYTTVMGLPGKLVGIASAIGLVWDAVIDPLIGHVSDHSSSPFGRRHLFMLVGASTMGFSLWAFFSPPTGLSLLALFVWLLATSLLVRTFTSLFSIPYLALGAELSTDYQERTSVSGFRGGCALFGTLVAATLPFLLFFSSPEGGLDPKLRSGPYSLLGLAFGGLMLSAGLAATLGTLRAGRILSETVKTPQAARRVEFLKGFVASLRNPSFRFLFLSFSLFFLGTVINGILTIHFLLYFAKITENRAISFFQLAFYAGALAGVPFWLFVSRSVEKKTLYCTSLVVIAVLMGCAYALFGDGHPLGTGSLPPLLLGNALAGFFASVLWIMPASMIADIADQDELATRERREGTFFGIFHFGQQMATGLALLLAGILLDHFARLVPGQAEQSALTIRRLGLLYGSLPAGLLFIAALLGLCYSLKKGELDLIQARLAADRGDAP